MEDIHHTQISGFSGSCNVQGPENPRLIVGGTQKQLHPLSTLKTRATKLYVTKRIRDVGSINYKKNNQNSLRKIMSSFMLIAQCFALCPVQGITSLHAQDLRCVLSFL
jgi:hypothetical protein